MSKMPTNNNPERPDFTKAFIDFLKNQWDEFNKWVAVDPNDSFGIKSLKTLGKILGIAIAILLSPLLIVVFIIVFAGIF